MAELRFVGYLSELVGKRRETVFLEEPRRLRELLAADIPEERVVVLVNQRAGNLDSLIHQDDKVVLLPLISGGSS